MKKMLHKIFSILLAACFILSAVPAPAAAAENTPANTTNGSYVNGAWKEGGNGSTTVNIDGTDVTLSKTAAPVEGMENTFDITLKVQTSTTTTSSTADGAVVLVIDTSSSMEQSINGVKRIVAAKAAAIDFLESYAGSDASANRMLAIVTFDGSYRPSMGWTNVAGGNGQSGYTTASATINGLKTSTGTNMEGGLYEALGLLSNSAVSGMTKSVVLLSDGAPSVRIASSSVGPEKADCDAAVTQATSIKATGAALYTVCFGAERESAYWGGPTVGNFLQGSIATSANHAYAANDAETLSAVFKAIANDVTSGLSGEGWTATDPMADMISVVTPGNNFSSSDGDTYIWTLKDVSTSTKDNVTYYTYTHTYRVTLDVQGENFVEGQFFPTNEPTYLNVEGKQYAFPVPGVTGVLPRTDISVTKKWEDNNNQDGKRTTSVEVKLQKKVNDVWTDVEGATATLNADNSWTHTWDGETHNLLVKSKGVVHEYQVVETEVPDGYTSTPGTADNDFTVTNTHKPEKISISGTKTWDDNNNQDGKRPGSITIHLFADGTEVDSKTVTANDNWAWSFTDLDKYTGGKEIVYTITEDTVDGYSTEVKGYNVTNTHVLDKTSVTVTKNWDDAENQDKKRPDTVTIHLFADGEDTGKTLTLSEENEWTGTFSDLIKNREGKVGDPVEYTVTEELPEENAQFYNLTDTETVTNEDGSTSIILTNTHELDTIDISVKKEWVDAENQDGLRKAVTIHLLADGNDTGKTLTLNEGNQWTGTFTGLTKNKTGKVGESIVYTITEDTVAGYEKTDITGSVADGFIVTNTHTPEKTSVKVTKVWDDAENQDGKRPTEITVQLLANGEPTNVTAKVTGTGDKWTYEFKDLDKYADGKEIAYTVAEQLDKDSVYKQTGFTGNAKDGFTITNSYTPELIDISGEKTWVDNDNAYNTRPESITITLKGGEEEQTVTVTADDDWKWSFTDLPKYAKGEEIAYTIVEEAVADYNTEYDDYNVINTLAPGKTSVTVTKVWEDDNNRDGLRPNDITVVVKNGNKTVGELILNNGNKWTETLTDLDKYNGGKEIVYTVEEVTVTGYDVEITGDAKEGFTITNTHEPEMVTISGTKTWDDGNNQDRTRPEAITVKLMDNGTEVQSTEVKPDANGKWTWTFTAPKYNKGVEIPYTVEEVVPEGYNATYPEGTYDIENFYSPETINIKVTKAWIDGDNQDGLRPEEIVVKLTADLTDFEETLKLNEDNKWTASFEELDKNFDGKEITYTLEEVTKVEGYDEPVIEGDHKTGFTVKNIHEPEVTEVIGKKTWNDANNQDGKRPESITVKLLANGQVVDTQVVSEKESWIYSFENLPKFEAGEEIIYTVVENEVPGYSATYSKDNYNITNSYTPETINIKVSKSWVDSNDADGIRPTKVTIYLYANGEKTGDKLVLTKDEKWTGSFTDLPKYEDGKEIKYTIAEKDVKGYNAVIKGSAGNGFTVTNSHNSIPKTGDERTPILWIAMMLLAIIVVFFASRPFFYKKGKYSR